MLTECGELCVQVVKLNHVEVEGESSSTLEALFVTLSHSVDNPCELVSHPLVLL